MATVKMNEEISRKPIDKRVISLYNGSVREKAQVFAKLIMEANYETDY